MQLKVPIKIDLENYKILRTIGEGSFGTVKLAQDKKTDKYVAIKMLSKAHVIKNHQIDHVYNEILIQFQIKHPFITSLEGFGQDNQLLYLVLEFVPGGDFFTYLRKKDQLKVDEVQIYSSQVLLMCEHLHLQNIAYRDIKPENLLISPNGYLKLTDFGFAKIVEYRTYTLCGTPEYIAPEIILNQGHGVAVDFWALGVLIYEMHYGIDPFTSDDPIQTYKNIIGCKLKFSRNFNNDCKSLVVKLIISDTSKRYGNLVNGIQDIKTHQFYKDINWTDIQNQKIPMKFIPNIGNLQEAKYFQQVQESQDIYKVQPIKELQDPFLKWWI